MTECTWRQGESEYYCIPRMLSSYQVVLWKQESFGVLRPLQNEFFRSLLDQLQLLGLGGGDTDAFYSTIGGVEDFELQAFVFDDFAFLGNASS